MDFLDGIDSVLNVAEDVVSGIERVVRPGHSTARTPPRTARGSSVEEVVDAQTRQTEYVVHTDGGTVVCSSAELANRVRDSLG